MNIKFNKRSTEWLEKGIPSNWQTIELLVDSEKIFLKEEMEIAILEGKHKIGCTIKLESGEIITIPEKEFNFDKSKDIQLHILFASKKVKLENTLISPRGFGIMLIAVLLAILLPVVGMLLFFCGIAMYTLSSNTYAYRKYSDEAFKLLFT